MLRSPGGRTPQPGPIPGGIHAQSTSASTTLVVGLLTAAGSPAQAITGNFEPEFEHEYVGLIVFYDADGQFLWRCSGSLLTDRVFLTAGHCTDIGEGAVSARVYFEQDAGANYDPATGVDPVSGYPETGGITAHTLYSYGFDNFAGFPNTLDVGLVILDAPVQTVYPNIDTYASLAAPGTLDAYRNRPGRDGDGLRLWAHLHQPEQDHLVSQPADGRDLRHQPDQPQHRGLQRAARHQPRW